MPGIIIDVLYLFFAAVTTYFLLIFLLLYSRNKSQLRLTPKLFRFPSVSIIVPAYNEQDAITSTLKSLNALNYPKDKLEIIVVDDGSEDNTYEVAKRFKNVKVLCKEKGGKANALNFGLSKAKGEIVACVDSDSHPRPDALLKSIPFFNDSSVAGVTTSIFANRPKNLLETLQWLEYSMIVWSRKLLEFLDAVYVTPGPLSLYRKNALIKVGGFDAKNMTEDIEIAWRLLSKGYKIKMATEAKTYTNIPNKLKAWWRQRIRWNIGGMQTMMKYKHTFLKSNYGVLGSFIWPFFSISYVLSLLGLGLFTYIILRSIFNQLSFIVQATIIGVNPLKHWQFWIIPDVFTIFGIFVFLLSITWVKISLDLTKEKHKPRNLFDYLIYLTFYITIFPANLFESIWRYATRRFKW
ncbi:MAG: glycosyltransferase family 2 protein [Candidatus Aenigmarchaeota archaeon]|nr:glycosyltransferase family 2 protein [Candidatus Aenigmarchaeota archaeon]